MWLVFHVTVAIAETHHPLPHCDHMHCLVSVNVQQASMNDNGVIFSAWRNSERHLYFIRTSMPDTILSDCPFAAIGTTATTCNGILAGRFNLYFHTPTSASDNKGQHVETGSIIFGATLIKYIFYVHK